MAWLSDASSKMGNYFNQDNLSQVYEKMADKEQMMKRKRKETERIVDGYYNLQRYPSIATMSSVESLVSCTCDISKLPERIIVQIFHLLSIIDLARCAQVNSAWRSMTQLRALWNDINFSLVCNTAYDKYIGKILQRWRPNILRLDFHGCSSLQWPSLKLINQCKNLQELNVSECQGFNDEIMRCVSEGCPALLDLNIAQTDITNRTLRLLPRCFPNLQKLSLAYCRKFTERGLLYLSLGKGCHKITNLDLSGCTQITVQGFKDIGNSCSGIKHLVINDMPTLTDNCIKALAERCKNITSIVFIGSPHLSDTAFKYLSECSLSKIQVEGNNRITDLTFQLLDKCNEDLHYIYMTDCWRITDVSLQSIANVKNLVVLNLTNCIRIGDTGIKSILHGPSGSKIRELNLNNCEEISDLALAQMGERCRSLTYLSLRNCPQLTDCGIEFITRLPKLISVDLSLTAITDEALTSLSNHKKLKELTVSECELITDLGVKVFCQSTPILEHLDVSYCHKLSGEILKVLSVKCFRLISLNIAGCPKMTDLAIGILSKKCHYIHILDISGCVRLTDKTIEYLMAGCKQLRVLKMRYCRKISKMANIRISSQVQHHEYSTEDPPPWFGYDYRGSIIRDKDKIKVSNVKKNSALNNLEDIANIAKN